MKRIPHDTSIRRTDLPGRCCQPVHQSTRCGLAAVSWTECFRHRDRTSTACRVWSWHKRTLASEHSSPCVAEGALFLTTFEETGDRLAVVCLDRLNGRIRWQKEVPTSGIEKGHPSFNPASSSPATIALESDLCLTSTFVPRSSRRFSSWLATPSIERRETRAGYE